MGDKAGHYLFGLDEKYYLYDFEGNAILEINKKIYDILKKYDCNQKCDIEEQEIINEFLDNGFLQDFSEKTNNNPAEEKRHICHLRQHTNVILDVAIVLETAEINMRECKENLLKQH